MVFIGYEPNIKGYHFWSIAQHRVFISTHILFDETIFPFCSRSQTDGPAPIPIKEERLTAYDEPSTEEPQRNLKSSQDHYLQVLLGINNPNQDSPDAGHASDHTQSSSSHSTWRPPLENELDAPSPLFLDSPEASISPPYHHSSPLYSSTKRAQLATGNWSSISNRHQHKCHGVTNSPPSSSSEENIPCHGPKPWLPPRQSANESLPEFYGCPHQHQPTINECSTFQPPIQCQPACIPIWRVLPNNTYGDRPSIHIKHDLEWGLVTIQEEPITVEWPTLTSMNEKDDIGTMYSQQWIQYHPFMAVKH